MLFKWIFRVRFKFYTAKHNWTFDLIQVNFHDEKQESNVKIPIEEEEIQS